MASTAKEAQVPPASGTEPLGIPSSESILGFQTEVFKELINKLAWSLGSTYRVAYSNQRSDARQLAIAIAKLVVLKQGYPAYLKK